MQNEHSKKNGVLNNGWILCPSKTFPGKYYYFNVASGEAVWTLNSNEKTTPKKESNINIQNVNNRFHNYPEPNTPPDDSPNTTPPNSWPNASISNSLPTKGKPYFQNEKYTLKSPTRSPWPECKQTPYQNQMFAHQTPMFGQPSHFVTNLNPFMPSMPNFGLPSFVWTPMQLPMSQWSALPSDKKPVVDRVTQTSQIDRGIYVHTSGVPLCEKFTNYEKPSLYFNTENKLINKPYYLTPSAPLKNINSKMEFSQNPPSKSFPDQIFCTETELSMKNFSGKSTLTRCSKIRFPEKLVIEELDMEKKNNFHQSDLRLLLNAKRKISLAVNEPVEKKKPKIDEELPLKKRVSFEMDKINETSIMKTNEQRIINPNIPTTKCNTAYMIPTSAQFNLNDCKTLKTINNTPKHNIRTQNIPKHNENAYISQNDMSKSPKQYIETNQISPCKMNIPKKCNENNIPTTANTDNCSKDVPTVTQYSKVKTPYTVRDIWYLIVDIDVLLEDLALVDQLLQSDEKCRLVIPQSIHSELEALCIGDCRGQQRVIVARQISRRMSTPQKQYVVEPLPKDENTNLDITDSILNSCMRGLEKQHGVVLITNNPYLREKACAQNICCFNTDEIRNGAILKPRLFSELKKLRVTVENDNKKDTANKNQEPTNMPIDVYKKRFFVKDKQKERDCDILINITKHKMDENLFKSDQFEINNRVQKINLEDSENKQEFCNLPAFCTQNICKDNNINTNSKATENETYKNWAQNQDTNTFNTKKFTLNTKSETMTHNNVKSSEQFETENLQNDNISFDSTPNDDNIISNGKRANGTYDNIQNVCSRSTTGASTASQQRIEKIIGSLNQKLPNKNTPNLNSFDKFKIPKLLPLKKETRMTSALKGRLTTTEDMRSNMKNSDQSLEGSLKKFCVKNKMIKEKLFNKMDEWICTYTQIMEHLLSDVLQNNSSFVKQVNVSNTNLNESLTCLKMLYNDTKLRDILEVLVKLLDQNTCQKGKIKLDIAPNDIMKMIGCGVLLVQTLKKILPDLEVLDDYESILNCLVNNIESKTIDVDPELLRPVAVCRSEKENTNKEARRIFAKNPSVIIEYLKKHYKAWSSYKQQDGEFSQTIGIPEKGYKVVRLSGKNINMLKIDNNRSISYINTTKDNNSSLDKDAETKLVKLLDSYNKGLTIITDNVHLENGRPKKAAPRKHSIFSIDSVADIKNNSKEKNVPNVKTTIDNQLKLIRFSENLNQNNDAERNESKEPNIIKNINILPKYETRTKDREPLDLDHLDYYDIKDINEETSSKLNEIDEKDFDNSDEFNFANDDFSDDDYKFDFASFFQTCIGHSTIINENSMHIKDENITDNDNIQNKCITLKKSLPICKEINKMEVADNTIKKSNKNFDSNARNSQRDDSTNDSGFENETIQAQALVHFFINELSDTFKVLYKFIVAFVQEIREEELCEERKNLLHMKSSKWLRAIRAVINQLKCIIERESSEATPLKATFLRYDKDTRVTQYRQIIQKCLEQAEILQNALKIIVCVTIDDINTMSTNANSICSSVQYLKIY